MTDISHRSDPLVVWAVARSLAWGEKWGQAFDAAILADTIAQGLGLIGDASIVKATARPNENGLTFDDSVTPIHSAILEGGYYFYESDLDRRKIDWYIQSKRAGTIEGQLIITGPAGQAKTQSVFEAGRRLNLPVYAVDCASITDIEKWVGHKEVDDRGTHFYLSEIMRWLEAKDDDIPPGIVLFDEITRLHQTLWNIMFPVFDGRRRIFLPEAHGYINVNPLTIPIATANIGGRYTGTFRLDHAMRERFGYTVERGFPPADEEVQVLQSRYPTASPGHLAMMVTIANRVREKWFAQDVELPVSTRMLVHAAAMVRDGASIVEAFEATVLPLFSEDGGQASERQLVRGIIEGKLT